MQVYLVVILKGEIQCLGEKKVVNFYTRSFLFLSMILVFSNKIAADESKKQVVAIIENLDSINPTSPSNCPEYETTQQNEEDSKGEPARSLTTKIADTLFSFIASEDNDKPVQFFLFSRVGINTDGSPKYSPVKKQRSDIRVLDSFLRVPNFR